MNHDTSSLPLDLLACPACRARLDEDQGRSLRCRGCDARYEITADRAADLVPTTLRASMAGDDRDVGWARWREAMRGLDASRGRRHGATDDLDDGATTEDLAALFDRAKVHGVVVDVGAADGARRGLVPGDDVRYVGIDPLPLARASVLTDRDVLVRGVAEALPLGSATADAVLCLGTFDYFADPHAAVAEMARVLRPGGLLALQVRVVSATVAHARGHRSRISRLASSVRAAREVGLGASAGLIGSALLERDRPRTQYQTRAQCTSIVAVRFELDVVREIERPTSTVLYIAGRKRRASRLPVIR